MSAPSHCLLLFTKPALAGRVKTRLTGEGGLSPERAARLHAAFLGDLVERLMPLAGGEGYAAEARLRLAWAPVGEGPLPDLAAELDRSEVDAVPVAAGAAVDSEGQVGADLGERLYGALARAAVEHAGGVAAVGSDHPGLPRQRVRDAFAALDTADVVLGPATDGGYYLIALRPGAVRRRLFEDIPWSTAEVLAATEERCRELGLTVAHLAVGHDVDEPADLARLAEALAAGPADGSPGRIDADDTLPSCPRTRGLLERWGLLPAAATIH